MEVHNFMWYITSDIGIIVAPGYGDYFFFYNIYVKVLFGVLHYIDMFIDYF